MKTNESIDNILFQFISELDIRQNTKSCYHSVLRKFYYWLMSKKYHVREPNESIATEFKKYLLDNSTVPSVNLYISVLKKYFAWLDFKGYYRNIFKNVRYEKRYKGFNRTPLTFEQVKKLLESVDKESLTGYRDYLILLILITRGIRAIELTRMNYNDFYTHGELTFIRTQPKGQVEKTSYIEVTDLLPYINNYLLTVKISGNDPLFVSFSRENKGKRLTTRTIRNIFNNHLRKIGISDKTITTHSLRHTSAYLLLEGNFSIFDVQIHLGHSSPTTTQLYTQFSQNKIKSENKTGKYLLNTILNTHYLI